MPLRSQSLANGEIYHVFNRGVASMPIFINDRHYQRALETVFYYQHKNPTLKYSYFARLPQSAKASILLKLNSKRDNLVDIISYCLMPNHFHFLLKQVIDNGITSFMRIFSNSYTHYFNTKNKRIGPLLQGRFKAVRIESEEQLLHVSRYIHLNPYSSGLVKDLTKLPGYPYSSLNEYLAIGNANMCDKEIILNYFKNPSSYRDFIFDQADYQRELEFIKHVTLDDPGA